MKPLSSFSVRNQLMGGLLVALLLLMGPAARAQAPSWQAAMVVGGSNSNLSIKATLANAGGDLYVAGGFSGLVTIGNTTLISVGAIDGFVAKWSPTTDSFVWAYRFGGTDIDQATALALAGNRLYVAGSFFSPNASFGNTILANYGGYNIIGTDAFVATLADAGSSANFTWAQRFGGIGQDAATALAVSGSNVYVGGSFASATANFGGPTLTNSTASSSSPSPDGFVAKLVDAGNSNSTAWVQPVTGPGAETVNALALNGSSLYATGSFEGTTAAFGSNSLVNASYSTNAYVAKLIDAGTASSWQWALRAGGSSRDVGNALVANNGRVYVAGSFASATMSLGSHSITNVDPSGLTSDAFIAALTDAGSTATWTWAQPVGGTANDFGTALTPCTNGGLYLAGSFASTTVTMGTTTLPNANGGVLVARLTDTGTAASLEWAQQGGAPGNATSTGVALASGRVYLTGSFQSTATFGSQTLANSPQGPSTNFMAFLNDVAALTATTSPALSGTGFSLYPNPATATTTVTLPAMPGNASVTLTLRDALGRALRTATVALPTAGLRQEFDLTSLPAGVYALQVQAGAATAARRLVVE